MATNFTNKYMQVFQDYNEFGEHSADYVRGEDHIAFLIEENEVIYWLYLEQVWRPLNVRTTTTGQLEDGRTKVAVRLEYIEGGQKYTSVPNIPDPERITSMSHFLEDYPDIEEVNVSGTVNLTDLDCAFAGSKIKDFSMLDTSNVINITAILENAVNENLECIINTNVTNLEITRFIKNATIKGITINALNATSVTDNEDICMGANFEYINVNAPNAENQTNYITINVETTGNVTVPTFKQNWNNDKGQNKIYTAGKMYFNNNNNGYRKEDGGTTTLKAGQYIIFNYRVYPSNNSTFIINCNDIRSERDNYFECQFGSKIVFNENAVFGDKLWFNNFSIACNGVLNDAIYQKYAGHKISIFQYNVIGESIADVNISSEVDSNLLYVDWSTINFDTIGMNIEINNVIRLYVSHSTHPSGKTFNKFILDNRNLSLEYDDYPKDDSLIDGITANEGYISGNYVCYANWSDFGSAESYTKLTLKSNTLIKNVVLWDYSCIYIEDANILTNNNIKFDYSKASSMPTIECRVDDVNISNLKDENNIVTCALYTSDEDRKILYNENIILNIIKGYHSFYLKLILDYVVNENEHTINNNITIMDWNNYLKSLDQITKIENVYLHGNITLNGFYTLANSKGDFEDYEVTFKVSVSNIYGENLTISLPILNGLDSTEILNVYPDINVYKHIDIYQVTASTSSYITIFQNLDNESTINLITKLVDNTNNSTKTIYMYRSQANIIGEENIAGAVAKNYEIAIIEN